ncbi:hypothetical protein [Saccharibacillus brassicae]|uniref:hypothetical protein n=1 Tax=Saccharibacillus brassicae TaxID=2583377 RepID=UPI0014790E5D|nr:hypothetical protein [Saccharibacillus brassicae]
MSNNHDGKHSSKKMSALASKVLHDKSAEKKAKSLAGSVLSQAETHSGESDSREEEK